MKDSLLNYPELDHENPEKQTLDVLKYGNNRFMEWTVITSLIGYI